jgi:hypothetical protein
LATPAAKSKARGSYACFTPKQQADISKYALLHGNKAAIRYYSIETGKQIKESIHSALGRQSTGMS